MRKRALFLFVTAFAVAGMARAQDEPTPQEQRFTVDTPVNLNFEQEAEPVNTKKKKVKKRVYYGLKTKKGFTKKGEGDRVSYELFYYLKEPQMPQTFVRDIYWFDFTRHEIRRTSTFDPKKGVLLHGPYERRQNQVIVEKGIFYRGTKHGRWMKYQRDSTLVDKERYFQGWPKESLVSYYDPTQRKKMKEMTPIEYGEKEGYYYYFHENGKVAILGEYQWDHRVGDWTEYYANGNRKKILSYPKDAFDEASKPYVKAEWNEKGKEIYRNNKMSTK